mgnify:CR=1 FL=1
MSSIATLQIPQAVGRLVVHRGHVPHEALPITAGSRMNLILWCRIAEEEEEEEKEENKEEDEENEQVGKGRKGRWKGEGQEEGGKQATITRTKLQSEDRLDRGASWEKGDDRKEEVVKVEGITGTEIDEDKDSDTRKMSNSSSDMSAFRSDSSSLRSSRRGGSPGKKKKKGGKEESEGRGETCRKQKKKKKKNRKSETGNERGMEKSMCSAQQFPPEIIFKLSHYIASIGTSTLFHWMMACRSFLACSSHNSVWRVVCQRLSVSMVAGEEREGKHSRGGEREEGEPGRGQALYRGLTSQQRKIVERRVPPPSAFPWSTHKSSQSSSTLCASNPLATVNQHKRKRSGNGKDVNCVERDDGDKEEDYLSVCRDSTCGAEKEEEVRRRSDLSEQSSEANSLHNTSTKAEHSGVGKQRREGLANGRTGAREGSGTGTPAIGPLPPCTVSGKGCSSISPYVSSSCSLLLLSLPLSSLPDIFYYQEARKLSIFLFRTRTTIYQVQIDSARTIFKELYLTEVMFISNLRVLQEGLCKLQQANIHHHQGLLTSHLLPLAYRKKSTSRKKRKEEKEAERNRTLNMSQVAVSSIIDTHVSFLAHLKGVYQAFSGPPLYLDIEEAACSSSCTSSSSPLSSSSSLPSFASATSSSFHQSYLKQANLFFAQLGSIIMRHAPLMSSSLSLHMQVFEECQQLLRTDAPRILGMEAAQAVSSSCVAPVRRIPRYTLLLQELR